MACRSMLFAAVSVSPLLLVAVPAYAQEAPVTAEADAAPVLGDIVVTAQRRSERLQDVPVPVTAFTDAIIDQLHLTDTIEISKFVPSMISNNNAGLASANTYFLRGLGNTQSVATFDPPVGTYVDDIYIARQNANNYAFFDTERVEVLRGPQGTLFGRNTTGGAVSVIMRKPSDAFGAKFEATGGSYDRYTIKGVVDVPVSPNVLTKLAAFYVTDKGYLKNITTGESLNGEKNWGVRGDVRFLLGEALTLDLSAEYTRATGTYLGTRTLPIASSKYKTTTTPIFYETAAGLPKTSCRGDLAVNILRDQEAGNCSVSNSFAVTGRLNWESDAGTLSWIAGYRDLDQAYINQYNANATNVFGGFIIADNSYNSQWSQELKWNGTVLDDRLTYVAGLFYLTEKTEDLPTNFSGGTTSFVPVQANHFFHKVETAAAYLQADYKATDAFTITLGGRYTWERKKLDFETSTLFPGLGFDSDAALAIGVPLRQTEKRFTPRIAVSYKLDPDVMLYASATNGFKSGGWNGGASTPTLVSPFEPERTWSYEAGLKSELFNNRLRFNVNGYFAETKDLQVTAGLAVPGQPIASRSFNVGTLEVYGLEIESSLAATRELNLFANISLMHGEYTYVIPASTQVTTATKPVRVPTFQLSSGAIYTKEVPELNGSLFVSGAWRHNSPYWVALLNTTKAPVEDFVDASIGYNAYENVWGLSFEVSNLTDQKTLTANFLSLFPGDPRRYTVRLKVKI